MPGTYRDAMTTNTPLGKAVKGACDELDALGSLVRRLLCGCRAVCRAVCRAAAVPCCAALCCAVLCCAALCRAVLRSSRRVSSRSPTPSPNARRAPLSACLQERQTLEEAEGLLKKLGFKGSLFAAPQQPQQGAEQQAAEQPGGDGGAQ